MTRVHGVDDPPPPPGSHDGGRGVRGRLRLWAATLIRSGTKLWADGGPHYAAAISFRVLFSLFPLVIVLTAIFGVVVRATGVRADVVDAIVRNVPLTDDGKAELETLLEGATGHGSTLGLIALVGLVWAAGGMMASLRTALNIAWEVDQKRPFVQGKLVDLGLIFAASVLVGLSLIFSVAGRVVSRYATDTIEELGIAVGLASMLGGLVAPFVLSFGAVVFLYRVVPAVKPPLSDLVPGALLVATAAVLLQTSFAVYLEHFANYNAVYGSIGAVISFLFLVYIGSLVLLFGAELSACLPRMREELRRDDAEATNDSRGFIDRVRNAAAGLVRRTD